MTILSNFRHKSVPGTLLTVVVFLNKLEEESTQNKDIFINSKSNTFDPLNTEQTQWTIPFIVLD